MFDTRSTHCSPPLIGSGVIKIVRSIGAAVVDGAGARSCSEAFVMASPVLKHLLVGHEREQQRRWCKGFDRDHIVVGPLVSTKRGVFGTWHRSRDD